MLPFSRAARRHERTNMHVEPNRQKAIASPPSAYFGTMAASEVERPRTPVQVSQCESAQAVSPLGCLDYYGCSNVQMSLRLGEDAWDRYVRVEYKGRHS